MQLKAGDSVTLLIGAANADVGEFADWADVRFDRETNRHLAFGAGPRFCPGRNLALLEARSALAMLTRNFEVSLPAGAPEVEERFGFTMSAHGLKVLLTERSIV